MRRGLGVMGLLVLGCGGAKNPDVATAVVTVEAKGEGTPAPAPERGSCDDCGTVADQCARLLTRLEGGIGPAGPLPDDLTAIPRAALALDDAAAEVDAVGLEDRGLGALRDRYTALLRETTATMRSFVEALEAADHERAHVHLSDLFGQIERTQAVTAKMKARCASETASSDAPKPLSPPSLDAKRPP